MLQARGEFLAHLLQRPAGEVAIDVVADGGEFVAGDRLVERHHAVVDFVIARDDHHEHAAVRQRNQFDMFQRRAELANGGGDADAAGHIGQHAGGVFDALLHRFETAEFGAQALDFGGGHAAQRQRLHVAAERFFGGNAAGGGVRLGR